MVGALTFHQCGRVQVKTVSGLILLVLYSPLGDFSPVTQVFPSHQKVMLENFDMI